MAQVVDTETVNNFTINRVPSQAVFDSMLANDQVNENELYIVEGDVVPEPATATPLVESGSGAVGTSDKFAREDHVHPARTISSNEVIDNSDVGGANVQASLTSLKVTLNPITISSYADITAFINANSDGYSRLCYIPATFMSTLSQGKNNAIGIGYVSRANATIADFFLRTGYDKIWTIRVNNGATTQVTLYANAGLITTKFELAYTATQAYAIGDIININNTELIRMTRAVSSGTAFVVGTNCESITVGKKLADLLNPVNVSVEFNAQEAGDSGFISAKKLGRLVQLTFMTARREHADGDLLSTLPTEIRPSEQIQFIGRSGQVAVTIRLLADGRMQIWSEPDSASSARVSGFVTYVM